MNDKVLFFLLGPTCVGKTNLSLRLFNYFPVEIINVDSSMIYKFMDIGTGKPCFNIRSKIKHHLVDIRTPLESYSVWDFCLDSFFAIFDCLNRNKIPLFVGGTMMYVWYLQNFFKSLNENIFVDSKLKSEFFYLNNKLKIRFSFINIFLLPFNKDIFYCKIRNRVWEMLDFGFLDEVVFLKSKMHLNLNCSSLKSIGYKDLWFYLDGKISFVDAVNSIFESTVKLADNQLKWSKKFSDNSFFIENKENFFLKKCIEIFNLYL